MPSLRKRVSSYFRQLSFHNDPREKRNTIRNFNENTFVTKYLQGNIQFKEGPEIVYGKIPTDLPNYEINKYEFGPNSIIGCYSGPNGGLTTVRRIEKHLSILDGDIDFIDTPDEAVQPEISKNKSPNRSVGQPIDNTTMVIKMAGNEYFVTNKPKRRQHNKSHSLGSISDFKIEIEKTKIERKSELINNNNCDDILCKNKLNQTLNTNNNSIKKATSCDKKPPDSDGKSAAAHSSRQRSSTKKSTNNSNATQTTSGRGYNLAKSKSEGAPFHQKKGRIIKIAQRNNVAGDDTPDTPSADLPTKVDDSLLPAEWNRKTDTIYGISDSLYDRNQVTKNRNGDPIADCFGIISRKDSAILAVADGVNWGEKASIAAKSAVHGCLHYLNKTIFHDVKPFECITIKTDDSTSSNISISSNENIVSNSHDVFVSLLRAFNCAHDLILENNGMLTTLTVAVVLPLKRGSDQFVCCACNVGDTLAYVYSPRDGVREITKGSHDIYGNRDMRDALGALGPVDGIKPELSNLTLSLTILQKGDIVLVASDGLTDNFDPNVCKFTVNTAAPPETKKKTETVTAVQPSRKSETPPVKPPRKSKPNSSLRQQTTQSLERKSVNEAAKSYPECENPLVAHFVRENSVESSTSSSRRSSTERRAVVVENRASSLRKQAATSQKSETARRPNSANFLLRSKTTLDMRANSAKRILRNEEGVPYVTPLQRYELQLLLMEDVLKNGISGQESPCTTAKRLCENLIHFTISMTSAKRHTLEDPDLYYENRNGVLVEVSGQEKKLRRKRGLEKVQHLPGKLDHVTVVACNIGG